MTADPEEMHQLMGKVWVEGIFNKKDIAHPFADWVAFADEAEVNGHQRSELMEACQVPPGT